MTINEIIRKKRIELGITQQELAIISLVSQSYISKLEADEVIPSIEAANSILNALEMCIKLLPKTEATHDTTRAGEYLLPNTRK